jgi:hypothetical protein
MKIQQLTTTLRLIAVSRKINLSQPVLFLPIFSMIAARALRLATVTMALAFVAETTLAADPSPNMNRTASSLKLDVDGQHWYGADCSGLVSMAWHLPESGQVNGGGGPNTRGLPNYSDPIGWNELQSGDILNDYYDHVFLFHEWETDGVHFRYFSFGSSPPRRLRASINDAVIDGQPKGDYVPRRRKNLVDGTSGGGYANPSSQITPIIEYLLSQ